MSRSSATKRPRPRSVNLFLSLFLSLVTFVFLSLVFSRNASAVDITLAWDANTEPTLDGYRVFYRQEGDSYRYNHPDWAGGCTETTCTIYGLDDHTKYYFVARAVDNEGNESADSNEVCYQPNVVYTGLTTNDSDPAMYTPVTTHDGNTAIYDDDRGDFGGGCFMVTVSKNLAWEENRL